MSPKPDTVPASQAGSHEDNSISNQQALTIACYIFVVGVIGVPLWWKTTEVYRVGVPHNEISALAGLSLRSSVPIVFHVTGDNAEYAGAIAQVEQLSNGECSATFSYNSI